MAYEEQVAALSPEEPTQPIQMSGRGLDAPTFDGLAGEEGPGAGGPLPDIERSGPEATPKAVQRKLPTRAEFVTASKLSRLKSLSQKRSAELQAIDGKLGLWETYRPGSPLSSRIAALDAILDAIQTWKAQGRTNRLTQVEDLEQQVSDERDQLQLELDTKNTLVASIVPTGTFQPTDSPAVKARSIFASFMTWVRSAGISYATQGSGDILAGARSAACGTFAKSLAEVLTANGVPASVMLFPTKKFITDPIGANFADPNCNGNLTNTDNLAEANAVRRFFFTEHYVTSCGGLVFDPTAGQENGPGIFASGLAGDPTSGYTNGTYTVKVLGNGPTGGVYKVTPALA